MDFSAINKDPPHIVKGFDAKQLQGTWYKVRRQLLLLFLGMICVFLLFLFLCGFLFAFDLAVVFFFSSSSGCEQSNLAPATRASTFFSYVFCVFNSIVFEIQR